MENKELAQKLFLEYIRKGMSIEAAALHARKAVEEFNQQWNEREASAWP